MASIISRDRKFSLNPLVFSFRLNQFMNGFTENFIRKRASWDTLVISTTDSVGLISEMITANEKYKAKWTVAKIKYFDPALRITKSCCRAVPDEGTCMYLSFRATLEPIDICNSTIWFVRVPAIIDECVLCLSGCKIGISLVLTHSLFSR